MTTCKHCGWEIKQDFGAWIDAWEHAVCWWQEDVAMPHEPLKQKVKSASHKVFAA